MDDLKCHLETKFLAKTYVDLFLQKAPNQHSQNLGLLGATAMLIAIKVDSGQLSSTKASTTIQRWPLKTCTSSIRGKTSSTSKSDFWGHLISNSNTQRHYVILTCSNNTSCSALIRPSTQIWRILWSSHVPCYNWPAVLPMRSSLAAWYTWPWTAEVLTI